MTPWTPELLTAAIVERRLEGDLSDIITFEGTTGRGPRSLLWDSSTNAGVLGLTCEANAVRFCNCLNEVKARIYVSEG